MIHGVIVSSTPELRIALPDGRDLAVTATAEQVARASGLREVSAMVVMSPSPRLIWIRQKGADVPVPPAGERDAHALRKWSELLRRLAQ
ncbi:hypothetical protein D7X55_20505 [Corallococcus sp. AB049A]|uniref:Uncharacterized protein n=1 Tax=Corallococcus interemptor TaxID=2316720 RepID=A0A3A8QYF2_9BACT|nr:hypothetical protein D7X96_03805 [Corallococcus interemptor]RKI63290.1 hypothetical protein D7X55_20505 [Corallococcus sp. AB049A]